MYQKKEYATPPSCLFSTVFSFWKIPNFPGLYQILWDLPVGTKGAKPNSYV